MALKKSLHSDQWSSKKVCTLVDDPMSRVHILPWALPCAHCALPCTDRPADGLEEDVLPVIAGNLVYNLDGRQRHTWPTLQCTARVKQLEPGESSGKAAQILVPSANCANSTPAGPSVPFSAALEVRWRLCHWRPWQFGTHTIRDSSCEERVHIKSLAFIPVLFPEAKWVFSAWKQAK